MDPILTHVFYICHHCVADIHIGIACKKYFLQYGPWPSIVGITDPLSGLKMDNLFYTCNLQHFRHCGYCLNEDDWLDLIQ
jgi:hypothetical protein